MEIKTCEQYIINRLMELENEVDKQTDFIKTQADVISNLEKKVEYIRNLLTVKKSYNYPAVIIELSIWDTHEKETFDELVRMFNLNLPEPCCEDEDCED